MSRTWVKICSSFDEPLQIPMNSKNLNFLFSAYWNKLSMLYCERVLTWALSSTTKSSQPCFHAIINLSFFSLSTKVFKFISGNKSAAFLFPSPVKRHIFYNAAGISSQPFRSINFLQRYTFVKIRVSSLRSLLPVKPWAKYSWDNTISLSAFR